MPDPELCDATPPSDERFAWTQDTQRTSQESVEPLPARLPGGAGGTRRSGGPATLCSIDQSLGLGGESFRLSTFQLTRRVGEH